MVIEPADLVCRRVGIGESDLLVCALTDLSGEALESLAVHRTELEEYVAMHTTFAESFRPVPVTGDAPGIVRDMGEAAEIFEVGPMAAVAGAVAQHVGTDLLGKSSQVIVENGGDVFMAGWGTRRARVFPVASAPSGIDIAVEVTENGVGLCTSSATVGPSVSFGQADAVAVLARTATLADAAATAIGNRVRTPDDIADALKGASQHPEVMGAVVVIGGSVGAWGAVELC